ncbi:hypothetical protein G9U51_04335 [Calidifontibacter sp. DB0510]|uniref:Dihydroorotate dehydrogenase electron transfer subunit iron-sulphur cluster binding domain-containing protein n=2 Tax=Metallococcus carri TaxID=1656884 RepID=A0A967AZ09_9MICO|nr:hypothetical protein [Metallococcus carri]NOP37360.1 hypothetical protein [Calidifontibacter sp. DB2511S]
MGAFRHHTLVAPDIADRARPGQMVSVAIGGPASALVSRRTLPIAAASPSGTYGGTVDVIVDPGLDAGMAWLGDLRAHDEVAMIGPVGRAYPLPTSGVDVLVVGVGASAAPVGWLAAHLRDRGCRVDLTLAGPDDRHLVGVIEARRIAGSVTVLTGADPELGADLAARVRTQLRTSEIAVVYAAGRARHLAPVVEVARPFGVVVQCCVDEDMPCGTGLCGSCEIPVRADDGMRHTIRGCTEGAVLRGDRVDWAALAEELG